MNPTQRVQPAGNQSRLVNVQELAAILAVPPSWVYQRTRQGAIPCLRVGKYVRFDPEEVLAALRGQQEGKVHTDGDS